MHHYCYALFNLREALKLSKNEALRGTRIRHAIEDFDYVLDRSDSTFVLRPEILVRKGMALALTNDEVGALTCFQEALEVRSDFVAAYVVLSNYFARSGDYESAKEILEVGLSRVPDAEVLQRKLSELRGADPGGDR
jgi:tetratricopeptide (TPR) repeat protein